MRISEKLVGELNALGNPNHAQILQRFFKTGPGEYGEGDQFIGVKMPVIRATVKPYTTIDINETEPLLVSPIHEHRMAGLIILAEKARKEKDVVVLSAIFDMYLRYLESGYINNWDLVDVTVEHCIGKYLLDKPKGILFQMTQSTNVWVRRAAIVSQMASLKKGEALTTYQLAEALVEDKHDLIHKAVGWQLREMGKRVSEKWLIGFLDNYYKIMPRTMLRYAIEKLNPIHKAYYMKK
jgi:3-methyladenine DNA glycosylase AlkD